MGLMVSTKLGDVEIIPQANAGQLRDFTFHAGFGEFDDYHSILTRPEVLAREAENGRVAVAVLAGQIIGYVVLRTPLPGERWREMAIIREIYCELARGVRGENIIQVLLKSMHQYPEQEDLIYYLVGYTWHWDLKHTGRSVREYRQAVIKLVEPYGYREYPTNDPNVGLHAENIFMARLGANLPPQIRRAFNRLLFGITA